MSGKLAQMTLSLTTGARGRVGIPVVEFNGHRLPLGQVEGACGANERLNATIRPASVAHTVRLLGPDDGFWDIEALRIDYVGDAGTWSVEFDAFVLDADSSADIFRLPPLPVWDV